MAQFRCPICDQRFESSDSSAPPFCSERCRRIDLGRWFGESYALPVEHDDEDAPEGDEEEGGRMKDDG